ncbi:DUF5602 domain-containing protein [Pontibacter russatus]|uniref:DUF5602 domain-containing protein n=1 Tax=Pontibacter russatus TaxID=2694929 RepID=UPI00137B75CC|nr:DUF5602 domain-containing protein [Pontibacter russatus]
MIKTLFKSMRALPLFLVLTLLSGCEELEDLLPDDKNDAATYYGPTKDIGNGTARTWVKISHDGEPLAVGISMTEDALEGLPETMGMYMLEMPKQMSSTLYEMVMLDWNPQGHEPDPIYTHPHFDMHFYMISDMERMAIPGGPHPHTPAFMENYIPANYITGFPEPNMGEAVPGMGVHWVDVTSPEFHGHDFTKTFVYGSYNNEVIFHEPMITTAYLKGLAPDAKETAKVPQPLKVQKTGYYPTSYSVAYDAIPGEYIISLRNMKYRMAQ